MTIRIFGACHSEPEALNAFIGQITSTQGAADLTLMRPADGPSLAVLVQRRCPLSCGAAEGPDGLMALVAGPLFNAPALRAHLASAADLAAPALVLALWRREGRAALDRLDCGGTVIVFDPATRELVIARDRNGTQPIFHAESGGRFVFASELPPLAAMGLAEGIDLRAMDSLLARGFVPSPFTLAAGIRQVPPGHLLLHRPDKPLVITRYARTIFSPKISDAVAVTDARPVFQAAMARQISGLNAPGVLLSGGVDSALIAAGLVRHLGLTPPAFTFTYAAYDGPYNETPPARRVAEALGLAHHEITVGPQDVAERFDPLVLAFGQPFSFGLHSFKLDAIAAQGVDGLFTGAGADSYSLSNLGSAWVHLQTLPQPLRAGMIGAGGLAGRVAPGLKRPHALLAWSAANGLPTHLAPTLLADAERLALFADRPAAERAQLSLVRMLQQAVDALNLPPDGDLYRASAARFFSADCMLAWYAAWGRVNGLVFRHPLLDSELLGIVHRTRRIRSGKPIIRGLAADLLPREAALAPKVHQTIPIGVWMRGPLKDFLLDRLSPKAVATAGLFDPAAVTARVNAHLAGEADEAWVLLTLMGAQSWAAQVLGGSGRPSGEQAATAAVIG